MDEVHSPVWAINPCDSFRYVYVNAAACEHHGYSQDVLLNMTIPEWDPNFPLSACEEFWQRLKREKKITFESVHRFPDGKLIPVEVTSSYFSFGGEEFIVGFVNGITARKKAEAEIKSLASNLARSNESLKQFAYIASHDLQEPLRMVASFVKLLEKNYSEQLDQNAIEYINLAVDGVLRMKRLIDALLEYSRVENASLRKKSVDMTKLVEQVRRDMEFVIAETGAEVRFDRLPEVVADEVQMGQLLQNLIGNALKFRGDRRPRIYISAKAEEGHWAFAVRDEGIGIEERFKDRMFEIFQRLHARDEYPGTGLGLAICKKIVERHGGRIWLESELGRGTTFYFTITKS